MPAESHRGSSPTPGAIRGKASLLENAGKLGMVAQTSNSSTGEVEAGGSRGQSCSHLHSESDVSLSYMSLYLKSRCPDLRA